MNSGVEFLLLFQVEERIVVVRMDCCNLLLFQKPTIRKMFNSPI